MLWGERASRGRKNTRGSWAEAGGEAVPVGEKGGVGILPEARRPPGLFSPLGSGGSEAGSAASLPRV